MGNRFVGAVWLIVCLGVAVEDVGSQCGAVRGGRYEWR